jgi:pimeloyl-CoA dehydrogenase
MELNLSPEQRAFRDDVRAFIRDRLPADIRERLRAGNFPRKQDIIAWQRILNERGWAAPHWPKRYGGADLGQMERLILLDEIYRAPAPIPSVFNVIMLGPVLLKYGTETQKEFFLPKLLNMDLWFCQGFSEPGAGSDLASLRTSARREGDQYVVNGQKIWTSSAHHADWMFALVRTDPEARKQQGISFLLIDMKTRGISVRPIISLDGDHHLNEVFLDEVRVPVSNLVGDENKGWDCAKFLLANERTGIANVGLCRERLDYARELAAHTLQAGRPLLEDVNLRREIATLDAEIRALEITNARFLLTESEQRRLPSFASVLKLKGTEIQQAIYQLLTRIAGPAGLERRTPAEPSLAALNARYFYSRAASIYGGSSEVQKDILAKTAVG